MPASISRSYASRDQLRVRVKEIAIGNRATRGAPSRQCCSSRTGQLQVLVGRGVREAPDMVHAGLLDARADAPEEGQLVDGHVQHAVVHDLLDLVDQGLALLPVHLAGLPLVEVLDL